MKSNLINSNHYFNSISLIIKLSVYVLKKIIDIISKHLVASPPLYSKGGAFMVTTLKLGQNQLKKQRNHYDSILETRLEDENLVEEILQGRLIDKNSYENLDMSFYDPFFEGV